MRRDKLVPKIHNVLNGLSLNFLNALSLNHPAASMIIFIETLFECAAEVAVARVPRAEKNFCVNISPF